MASAECQTLVNQFDLYSVSQKCSQFTRILVPIARSRTKFDLYEYLSNALQLLDLHQHINMTDSPAVQAPLDPREAPILDRVLALRDRLLLLKQDKSTYVKSHDVLALYAEVIEQVHQLNEIRKEHGKPLEQNRGLFAPSWTQSDYEIKAYTSSE